MIAKLGLLSGFHLATNIGGGVQQVSGHNNYV